MFARVLNTRLEIELCCKPYYSEIPLFSIQLNLHFFLKSKFVQKISIEFLLMAIYCVHLACSGSAKKGPNILGQYPFREQSEPYF